MGDAAALQHPQPGANAVRAAVAACDQRDRAAKGCDRMGHILGVDGHDDAPNAREGVDAARQNRAPIQVAPLLWRASHPGAAPGGSDDDGDMVQILHGAGLVQARAPRNQATLGGGPSFRVVPLSIGARAG